MKTSVAMWAMVITIAVAMCLCCGCTSTDVIAGHSGGTTSKFADAQLTPVPQGANKDSYVQGWIRSYDEDDSEEIIAQMNEKGLSINDWSKNADITLDRYGHMCTFTLNEDQKWFAGTICIRYKDVSTLNLKFFHVFLTPEEPTQKIKIKDPYFSGWDDYELIFPDERYW